MIRTYLPTDKVRVLELLSKNTPDYFAATETIDLDNYLQNEVEDYFVYEKNSEILGAGGINYFMEEKIARLSWDMIDPEVQGKGIGSELTQFRIDLLNKNPNIEFIVVRTTQLAYKFYEKMGFQLKKVEIDYWAKNFDLYQMQLKTNIKDQF